MRVFQLPDDYDGAPSLELTGKSARYVATVLRMGPGDGFDAVTRDGARWRCGVESASRDAVVLSVSRAGPEAGPGAGLGALPKARWPGIVLVQGLAKGMKMDLIVRQAVEAGVSRFIPVETEHSVPRAQESGGRAARWARVAREAMQQSGAGLAMAIEEPTALRELPGLWSPGQGRPGFFCHESPLDQRGLHGYLSGQVEEVAVCVGPEGGFSGAETRFLSGAGFFPIWLGPRVLRAETAALYAVAAIRTVMLERDSWAPSSGSLS